MEVTIIHGKKAITILYYIGSNYTIILIESRITLLKEHQKQNGTEHE